MLPIPSIDFLRGKPCRLFQGDPEQAEFYDVDPTKRALAFEKIGAKRFHLVNLDGALGGEAAKLNQQRIKEIVEALTIPVQVGGGIRNGQNVMTAIIELGISYVILGTSALSPDEKIQHYLREREFNQKLIADIGFIGDKVKIKGWQKDTDFNVSEAIDRIYNFGFRTLVLTDKSRDGVQTGPNLTVISREAKSHPELDFIISGGIGNLKHLEAIKSLGFSNIIGFIMGKRLWSEDGFDFFKTAIEMFI